MILVVASDVSMKVLPRSLDLIVVGAVRRQEVKLNSPASGGRQTEFDLLCRMNGIVVQDHVNLLGLGIVQCQFPE